MHNAQFAGTNEKETKGISRYPADTPLLGLLSPDGGTEGGLKTIEGRERF